MKLAAHSPYIQKAAATADGASIRRHRSRWALASLILASAAFAAAWLFGTTTGRSVLDDPRTLAAGIHHFVTRHPLASPVIYVAFYYALSLLLLPVWWLQISAGVAFGLYAGTLWSLIAATAGATSAAKLAKWFAGSDLAGRFNGKLEKLAKVDRALGHNGFLVVTAVRLVHLLPFGLSNYAFGLTTISIRDIVVGTFLGSIPAVAVYVGIGAGYHPWRNWRFTVAVAVLNALLLVPVGARYLKPQWFRRLGLE